MSDESKHHGLTHLDRDGNPRMVDVGAKPNTDREAVAEGWVRASQAVLDAIQSGTVKKGNVSIVAQLAGIQATKRTSDMIPLCHPVPIDAVEVDVGVHDSRVHIVARVRSRWRTGIEMEALTAVSAAALTVYDMCKAIDKGMRIEGIRLLEKRGGRSGTWKADTGKTPQS